MRILFLALFTFLLFSSFFSLAQTTYVTETKEEKKACNLVASLPEVINADNYIKKVTKGKRHLSSYLANASTKDVPYYWVKVVEDNGQSYHAHFHFYVQPKTYNIFYYDTVTDKTIPEKQIRKKLMGEYRISSR